MSVSPSREKLPLGIFQLGTGCPHSQESSSRLRASCRLVSAQPLATFGRRAARGGLGRFGCLGGLGRLGGFGGLGSLASGGRRMLRAEEGGM